MSPPNLRGSETDDLSSLSGGQRKKVFKLRTNPSTLGDCLAPLASEVSVRACLRLPLATIVLTNNPRPPSFTTRLTLFFKKTHARRLLPRCSQRRRLRPPSIGELPNSPLCASTWPIWANKRLDAVNAIASNASCISFRDAFFGHDLRKHRP